MKIIKPILFLAILATLFGIGFFSRDVLAGAKPDTGALTRVFSPSKKAEITPVETFQDNYNYILAKHGQSTTPEKLRYAAMTGLVNSLGDPHTNFLEPKINQRFSTETSGNYSGIGARLGPDPLGAKIATVFKTSPAFIAGIKEGDIITGVDGKKVAGKEVDAIVENILGEAGTTVKLTVIRIGTPGQLEFNIIRNKVEIPTVESKMLDGKIGYVSVSSFSEPTPVQFEEAVRGFDATKPSGLIIDLRSNPGGLLDAAIKMLSLFIENKPAVTIKARGGNSATLNTLSGQTIKGHYPITILINSDSASASEIFGGVMRDYKKAKLIGDHSYGKASVQELRDLPGGASAKITIAKYFLPASGNIGRKVDDDGNYLTGGLAPDFKVEIPRGYDFKAATPGKDPQLDKAIEYIIGNRFN
ncbi:MAG: S41 family peptidase [Fimbriimonadaceae bacterium]